MMRPLLFLLLFLCAAVPAQAGSEQLSESEFRALAEELSPKVNLFAAAWAADPAAEFYGGTTRDYLYWLKGKFREAGTRREAEAVRDQLRSMKSIDVREFIIGESDVDIVSERPLNLAAESFGVRKIDRVSPEIFAPASKAGQNERLQGFVPAEKVRLQRKGFATPKEFGDGLGEIYRGKLSVHFTAPDVFAKSEYAKMGENHPSLLALRYLRLQAVNYYQTYGRGAPRWEQLRSAMDDQSYEQVKRVLRDAERPRALAPFLERNRFRSWFNASVQKAYRSYSNPSAAHALMTHFGVTSLPLQYGNWVLPMNQYLFAKPPWDEARVNAALAKLRVRREALYTPPESLLPGSVLYHGTTSEEAFRSILFQGTLESTKGSAGAGLYAVSEKDRAFAERWGGDGQRLVRLRVKPTARIVDLTQGEGARALKAFGKVSGDEWERLADTLGADILRYPYEQSQHAYVVKNSAAVEFPEGVYRQFLPPARVMEEAAKKRTARELVGLLSANQLSLDEFTQALRESKLPVEEARALLPLWDQYGKESRGLAAGILANSAWNQDPAVLRSLIISAQGANAEAALERLRRIRPLPSAHFMEQLLGEMPPAALAAFSKLAPLEPAWFSRDDWFFRFYLNNPNPGVSHALVENVLSRPDWPWKEELVRAAIRADVKDPAPGAEPFAVKLERALRDRPEAKAIPADFEMLAKKAERELGRRWDGAVTRLEQYDGGPHAHDLLVAQAIEDYPGRDPHVLRRLINAVGVQPRHGSPQRANYSLIEKLKDPRWQGSPDLVQRVYTPKEYQLPEYSLRVRTLETLLPLPHWRTEASLVREGLETPDLVNFTYRKTLALPEWKGRPEYEELIALWREKTSPVGFHRLKDGCARLFGRVGK